MTEINTKRLFRGDVVSNLFFLIWGIVLLTFNTVNPIVGIAMISLFAGSAYMHYSRTDLGEVLDWAGMYLVFNSLSMEIWFDGYTVTVMSCILTLLALIMEIWFDKTIRRVVLAIICIPLVIGLFVKFGIFTLLTVLFLFSLSFTAREVAGEKYEGSGYALFHGLWHKIASYAIGITALIIYKILPCLDCLLKNL